MSKLTHPQDDDFFIDDPAQQVIEGAEEAPVSEGQDASEVDLAAHCKELICSHCDAKKEADNIRLRALAELDNTRKRLMREKEEHIRFAAEKVLTDIIPSLDALDLAINHGKTQADGKDLLMGVEMTQKLLLDSLATHGLHVVGVVGEPFSPEQHEAVGTEDTDAVELGAVSTLVSKGYLLQGRLLRPARVLVNAAQ